MTKKKILVFSTLPHFPFWEGSEMLWYNFVADDGVRAAIDSRAVLGDSPITREKGKILNSLGVETEFYTPYGSRFVTRNLLKTAQKLGFFDETYAFWYKKIEAVKPDLVLFNLGGVQHYVILDFAAKLCRKHDIPYWLILQGAPDFYFDGDEKSDEIFRRVVEGARRNIFQSEKNRVCIEAAVGKKLENAFVTRNGLTQNFIDKAGETAEKFPVRTEGKARILSLGRMQPEVKGQHILLEALSSANWKNRDWKLSFVGGGQKFLVERFIEYFKIDRERIEFTEKVSDIFPVVGASDLAVVPSVFEGTPLTAIEAMACARPVVGTPAGAMPEVIINGQTGWLAKTATASDYAEALENAWAARAAWREVGKNARDLIASEFNRTNYIPELLEVLLDDIK